jgi:hypothetical protein
LLKYLLYTDSDPQIALITLISKKLV